jgi:hypothetical protein
MVYVLLCNCLELHLGGIGKAATGSGHDALNSHETVALYSLWTIQGVARNRLDQLCSPFICYCSVVSGGKMFAAIGTDRPENTIFSVVCVAVTEEPLFV